MPRTINTIVIHCSATPSGQWLGGKAPGAPGYRTAVQVIEAWHRERGFSSIGYHYVVDLDGKVWRGRPEDQAGAHVAGFNAASLGICMVGGAEREGRYTPEQWQALATLVRDISTRLRLPLSSAAIRGHRDLSPDLNKDGKVTPNEWLKTCPGFDVSAWLTRGLIPEQRNVITGAAR